MAMPVYLDANGNIRVLGGSTAGSATTEEDQLRDSILNAYGSQTTYGVHLSRSNVTTGGDDTVLKYIDTELRASPTQSNASTFPNSGQTAAPDQIVNVNYYPVTQTSTGSNTSDLTDGSEVRNDENGASGTISENIWWPITLEFAPQNKLRSMTRTELFTMFQPALQKVINSPTLTHPGFYSIQNLALPVSSAVDLGIVATDTTADVSGFQDNQIPAAGQQLQFGNTTRTNYSLVRGDTQSAFYDGIFQSNPSRPSEPIKRPLIFHRSSGVISIKEMDVGQWEALIGKAFGWFISNGHNFGGTYGDAGRFDYKASGNTLAGLNAGLGADFIQANMGTGMNDTTLGGLSPSGGTYKTFQAGADDYRATEIPYGNPVVSHTSFLRGGFKLLT